MIYTKLSKINLCICYFMISFLRKSFVLCRFCVLEQVSALLLPIRASKGNKQNHLQQQIQLWLLVRVLLLACQVYSWLIVEILIDNILELIFRVREKYLLDASSITPAEIEPATGYLNKFKILNVDCHTEE